MTNTRKKPKEAKAWGIYRNGELHEVSVTQNRGFMTAYAKHLSQRFDADYRVRRVLIKVL